MSVDLHWAAGDGAARAAACRAAAGTADGAWDRPNSSIRTDCSGTVWCTSTRAAASRGRSVLIQGEELGNTDVGTDLPGLVAKEDVPAQLQDQLPRQLADFGDGAALPMPAVLKEQLAPVGPHAQLESVL